MERSICTYPIHYAGITNAMGYDSKSDSFYEFLIRMNNRKHIFNLRAVLLEGWIFSVLILDSQNFYFFFIVFFRMVNNNSYPSERLQVEMERSFGLAE